MFDNFLIHTFHDGNCLQAYKIFGAHFEHMKVKKVYVLLLMHQTQKVHKLLVNLTIGVKHLVIWKNIITEEFIPFL